MSRHLEYLKVSLQLRRNYLNGLLPTTANRERLEGKIEAINEVLREIESQQGFINQENFYAPRKNSEIEQS